jgi:hypothetical protein
MRQEEGTIKLPNLQQDKRTKVIEMGLSAAERASVQLCPTQHTVARNTMTTVLPLSAMVYREQPHR